MNDEPDPSIDGRQVDVARHLLAAGTGMVVGLAAATVIAHLAPVALALALGRVVEQAGEVGGAGLDSPPGRSLVLAVLAAVGSIVAERLATPVVAVLKASVSRRVDASVRVRTALVVGDRLDYAQAESTPVLQRAELAKGTFFGTPGAAAAAVVAVAGRYVQTGAALAVVGLISVPLAVAVLVVLVIIRRRWRRSFFALSQEILAAGGRLVRTTYVSDLAITPVAAKELRVFGFLDWIVGRTEALWHDSVASPFRLRAALRRQANVELSILAGLYVVIFVVLARRASSGAVDVGTVAAVAQVTFLAAGIIVPTADDFALEHGRAGLGIPGELERLADRPARVPAAPRSGPRPVPASPAPAPVGSPPPPPPPDVAFDDVTFAYPGATAPVLDGFTVDVPAGRPLALVGANGAGKTTFVKLLAGLYRPNRGQVLVDGVDLRQLDLVGWHRQLALIFQDFVRYEATAEDNVRFGDLVGPISVERLDEAARGAGARDLVASLPQGWATMLSAQYEGGVDLSAGQWQRLALARALYAVSGGATVLILDEPTANLDVRAEVEIYDRFLDLTAGRTSVVISHRFSTVRRAERIVVMRGGRVVETGSHDELLAGRGHYHEMFTLQAARFRDDGPAPEAVRHA